ncbi:Gamma-secretase subunit pen-2 [Frankliniella fusca]|uniref:Gamma-secretase subunit PEN-2 n=1 Tax=Frankliniella fusca TaxID=407009 RepID=A0AAE1HIW6_9NEOP|nr:Gamma-secretase subunit pen-2 [Frankliniella fusca]
MDLSQMRNEKKLEICKYYARGGWACLPILWAVNFIWFYTEAFRKDHFQEQKQIKRYVILSGIGALIWIVALTSWVILYQAYRVSWGDWGEAISFLVATGSG